MTPVVHLFVGLHKTGSSAIRFMLDVHRDLLPGHGFHLPRATWTQYVDGFWNGGHNNCAWEICRRRPIVARWGSVADLVTEINERPDLQHIVFTEDLDFARPDDIERLRQAFSAFDVRVIVFLRNQVDWLRSMSGEERKFFGAPSSEDWYRAHIANDPRVNYDAFCGRWSRAFGRIQVRTYEQIRTRALDAFLECCDAPPALRRAFQARNIPIINVSYGELPLTLIRLATDIARAQGIDHGYFNTVIAPAILTAVTDLGLNDRAPAPIPADAAQDLVRRMRVSNARLAATLGADLGDAYLAPEISEAAATPTPTMIDLNLATSLMVAASVDVGIRAGSRWQALGADAGLIEQAPPLTARYHPWPLASDTPASHALDELLEPAWTTRTCLYVERRHDVAVAYRHAGGELTELRRFAGDEWGSLLETVRARAQLNRASWNNLHEGRLTTRRGDESLAFWVRHVPAFDGDIIVVDPLRPASPSSSAPSASDTNHHLEAA